jgi:hypothetical protein
MYIYRLILDIYLIMSRFFLPNFLRGNNGSDDDDVPQQPPDRFQPPPQQMNMSERMEMGAAPPNPAHRNPNPAQQMNTAERMEMGASPPHPAHRNPTEEEKAAQEGRRNSNRPPKKKRPQRLRFNEDKNISNSFNENDAPEAIRRPRVREVEQQVVPISRMRSMPSFSTLAAAGSGEENSTTFRSISDAGHGDVIRPRSISPTTLREYTESIVEGNKEIAINRSPDSPDTGWHGGRRTRRTKRTKRTKRTRRTKRAKRAKRTRRTRRTRRHAKAGCSTNTRRRRSA